MFQTFLFQDINHFLRDRKIQNQNHLGIIIQYQKIKKKNKKKRKKSV